MKAALVFVGCNLFVFLFAPYAYACGDCYTEQTTPCNEALNTCQCADVNCGTNSCIDKASCCQDFGNVGDNKFSQNNSDIGDE